MALGKDYTGQDCSLARALELIGERWTILVLRDALYGVRRFNDFRARLDIPKAVLSERLQSLVSAGVMIKHPYQDAPRRDEYLLTETGLRLWPAIHSLAVWGRALSGTSGSSRSFRHAQCGTELGVGGACPRCREVVAVRDVEMSPGEDLTRDDPVSRALHRPRRLLQPVVRG